MPDAIFANSRLAEVYDLLDAPERHDLDPYLAIADEFGVSSVIDIGCGTGILACRLAAQGKNVIGIDPAAASLTVARRRDPTDRVTWLEGTATALPALQADLVTMTGNVAQVFVTDSEWIATLLACRRVIRPGGHLVFETRNPSMQAWTGWNRECTYRSFAAPGIGIVEVWCELTDVNPPFVSFRWTYVFQKDGAVLTSDSTLRFRSRRETIDSLLAVGFAVDEIRDAPDRPGLEWVFIARL